MTDEEKGLATIKPKMDLIDFKGEVTSLREFMKKGMHENYDYGKHPHTDNVVLKAPGAEKLAKRFGLVPKYVLVKEVEDFSKNFFFYKYKCELYDFRTGMFAGEAIRSAHSTERGMPAGVPANTVDARAQKRALLAAVRLATMASEIFYDGADEEDDEVPPGKPVTKAEDPDRVRLLSRFFVVAAERGFTSETAKSKLYEKYNVTTVDDVSNKQISETIEKLTITWKVVGKDGKPELINPPKKPESGVIPQPSPQVELDDIDRELGVTQSEKEAMSKKKALSSAANLKPTGQEDGVEEGKIVKQPPCYGCNKEITGKPFNGYYHDVDCQNIYLERQNPKAALKNRFNNLKQ